MPKEIRDPAILNPASDAATGITEARRQESLLKAGALQNAIFNSANFSSIATDAKGVIQIFNVGAERMLGYAAADVMNKITPADISDPQEVIARAKALSAELSTPITPGFEALVFKASRGIEDIYELTYIRKDGSRFPAVVSVTALRDDEGAIIGYLLIGTDITERKQAEETLRENRRQLTDIIEFLPDATLAIDKEGRIIIWNKAIEEMTGIPAAEMIGKCDYVYTIPFYGEARPPLMDLVFADREEIAARYPNITRQGNTVMAEIFCNALHNNEGAWVSAKASLLHDQSGNIMGAIETIHDITERKQTDEALRESENKYRLLIDNASESIVVIQDGLLKFINLMTLGLMGGYSEQELINRPFSEFIHPDDRNMVVENYRRRMAKDAEQLPQYAFRLVTRDGIVKWVEINAALIEWQGKPAMLDFLADITERKRAEETLQNERLLLRTLIDNIPDSIYSKDLACRKTLANLTEVRYLGAKSEADVLGKDDFDIYPKELAEKFFADDQLVIQTGEPVLNREEYVLDEQRQKHWLLSSKLPLRNQDGRIIGLVGIGRDITNHKRAEEESQRERAFFDQLVETAPEGIAITDSQSRALRVNAEFVRMFGYGADEVVGQCLDDLVAPPALQEEARELTKSTGQGGEILLETVRRRKDGTLVDVSLIVAPILIAGKQVAHYAIYRDITERKRAEEALASSLSLLKATVESTADGILVVDLNGRITLWNHKFSDMWQIPEELLSKHVDEPVLNYVLQQMAQPETFLAKVRELYGQPEESSNDQLDLADGRIFERYSQPQRIGDEVVGRVWSFSDITEHKQAEEKLQESYERFHLANLATHDVIWDWNLQTDAIWWSDNFQTVFSYPPEEIEPTIESWSNRIHPEDLDRVETSVHAAIDSGRRSWSDHYRFRRKDGSYAEIEDRGFIVREANGTPLRMIGAIQDVTNHKKVEEEIRALNADLDLRVRQRTAELTVANKELEAFSYSVSHDLRSPLRSIDGFSQAFLEDFGSTVPEGGREDLERVRRATQRMGQLIDDMLLLSRVTRSEMHIEATDMSALAAGVAEELARDNPQRDVQVSIEPGMTTEGDPQLLRIVLVNLLGNAWKFTSKREHAHISVGTVQDPERGPAFFVRDDGAGFDAKYKDKLFVAFQRLHGQDEFPGTGIGLATVERAIRRHGGDVWAEGEVDRGATFYFTIPDLHTSIPTKEEQP